jgi:thiol-disulfide isomerase/thioredoxin
MVRNALFAFALLSAFTVGCSSTTKYVEAPADDDAGATEDTGAAVEDTAPWNTYPAGPYGLNGTRLAKDGKTRLPGQTFPNLKFKGYLEEGTEWVDISMQDFYDPTGERGINAILVVVSAQWCGPCKLEAQDLPRWYTDLYKSRGAKFITAMVEQNDGSPATQLTVDAWKKAYKINFTIVEDGKAGTMDPSLIKDPAALNPNPSVGYPRNYIVNPRNMQIFRVNSGVDPSDDYVPGLNTLLNANGAPAAPAADAGTAADGG